MSRLRILVVENRANWQEEIKTVLTRLGGQPHVDIAGTYDTAVGLIKTTLYDLAVVDLALTDFPTDHGMRDSQGMQLVELLRQNPMNRGCGCIVLTGYPSPERTVQAVRDYGVHDFIEKAAFSGETFLSKARAAILDGRIRYAETRLHERYCLSVFFNSTHHITGTLLNSPERREFYQTDAPKYFDVSELSARADSMGHLLVSRDADLWRVEARAIGELVQDCLARDRRVYDDLVVAGALAGHFSDLAVEFCGPVTGLRIPFELAYDGDDYLALKHIVSRRVDSFSAPFMMPKPESFVKLLRKLMQRNESLRILLIAANSNSAISTADNEVDEIANLLEEVLSQIGVRHTIRKLKGHEASFEVVKHELKTGYYHLLHYAGHGFFSEKRPELSGLVVNDGDMLRILTASDLNLLIRGQRLHLAFISSCFGAKSGERVGSSEFIGLMDALVRADVSHVIGYRWTVGDNAAKELAEAFYSELFHTFSPGEALLSARRRAALSEKGRDEDSWASVMLVAQNG